MTAPAQGTEEIRDAGHVDVLIVGAGVSGVGAAHHLRDQSPDRTFVILGARDNRGGTWWTHRYPGVRSDSDLFTYGYRFKPWRGPSIAAGEEILAYLDEVIDEDNLAQHIRCRLRCPKLSGQGSNRILIEKGTGSSTRKTKRYTPEFKEQAAKGVVDHSLPIAQVARELGANDTTLGFWEVLDEFLNGQAAA
jgi:cation diffusion facilitator CzcD-associated flavoprotein CzcO